MKKNLIFIFLFIIFSCSNPSNNNETGNNNIKDHNLIESNDNFKKTIHNEKNDVESEDESKLDYSEKDDLNCCYENVYFDSYYYNPKLVPFYGRIELLTDSNRNLLTRTNEIIFENNEKISYWLNFVDSLPENYKNDFLIKESPFWDEYIYSGIEINTSIFCYKYILSYKATLFYRGDKGSPYEDYTNIDLSNQKLFNFNSIIKGNIENFNSFLLDYANKNRKEVFENYQSKLSQKADQLLHEYQSFLTNPQYDINKHTYTLNDKSFSHFEIDGAVFYIGVNDSNFIDYKWKKETQYVSYIVIPYETLYDYTIWSDID